MVAIKTKNDPTWVHIKKYILAKTPRRFGLPKNTIKNDGNKKNS